MRSIETVSLCWDNQEPGWFLRTRYDDGSELDEPCIETDYDAAPLDELQAHVEASGETWSPPVYHDHGGASLFVWSA